MRTTLKILIAIITIIILSAAAISYIKIPALDVRLGLLKLKVLVTAAKHGYIFNALPSESVKFPNFTKQLLLQQHGKIPKKLKGVWWFDGHPFGTQVSILKRKKNADGLFFTLSDSVFSGNKVEQVFFYYLVRYNTEFLIRWNKDYTFASIDARMNYPFNEVQIPAALFEGYKLDYKAPKYPTAQELHYRNKTGEYKAVCFCSIRYVNDNLIIRENYASPKLGYTIKRIIDGNGNTTLYYQEFLKKNKGKHFFKLKNINLPGSTIP